MTQYFIKRNNKVNGPFTPDQIKIGIKSKKLKTTDNVATSKDGPWEPLFGQENKAAQARTTAQPPPLPATNHLGQQQPKTQGGFPPPVGAGISEKTSPKTTKGSNQTLVIGATVAVLGFVTVAIYFGGTYLWQGASATWQEQQAQYQEAREQRAREKNTQEFRVEVGAGDVTITLHADSLNHIKIECNNGLVIDSDWEESYGSEFGYELYDVEVNQDYNKLAVFVTLRGVLANYLNGEYD